MQKHKRGRSSPLFLRSLSTWQAVAAASQHLNGAVPRATVTSNGETLQMFQMLTICVVLRFCGYGYMLIWAKKITPKIAKYERFKHIGKKENPDGINPPGSCYFAALKIIKNGNRKMNRIIILNPPLKILTYKLRRGL